MGKERAAESATLLQNTKWSPNFKQDEFLALAAFLEKKTYPKGHSIFVQGDKGEFMAFIIDGIVEIIKDVSDERDAIVVTLGPGNNFGELSLIDKEPRSASALAKEDVTLLLLNRNKYKKMLDKDPKLANKVLEEICIQVSKRLRTTTRELVFRI